MTLTTIETPAVHLHTRGTDGACGNRNMQTQIIDGSPIATFVINARHEVTHWNRACEVIIGMPASKVIGTREQWRAFYPEPRPVMADLIVSGALDGMADQYYKGKFRRSALIEGAFEAQDFFPHMGESGRWLDFTAAPLRDSNGNINGAIETLQDVTLRKQAEQALLAAQAGLEQLIETRTAQLAIANQQLEADLERRKRAEETLTQSNLELGHLNRNLTQAKEQLQQSEKMASIGQLAAGVAHEINNPIGYVQSNLGSLEGYLKDLFRLIDAYAALEPALPADHAALNLLQPVKESVDLAFLTSDVPSLLEECKEGITRVRKIVHDLKDFSRVDGNQTWEWASLHCGIDSTLNIVANEIKYRADVVKQYGEIPEIECLPSQLNQVFMNLLVNAAHAIDGPRGTITVTTSRQGDDICVAVTDTGAGIAPENLTRIFDPFFTTKAVGKGTGLGLSLSYGIVQKHQGKLEVDSKVGQGTTFRVILPVHHPAPEAGAAERPA